MMTTWSAWVFMGVCCMSCGLSHVMLSPLSRCVCACVFACVMWHVGGCMDWLAHVPARNVIATAATNGVVLVWDTERVGQSHRVTVGT